MKVLLINSVCGIGSTGKICGAIAESYEQQGHEVKIAFGRDATVPERFARFAVRIGSNLDVKLHALRTRLLDDHGFGSRAATREFLRWADEYDPDLVWLHNIHGYYINVEILFKWIKSRPKMRVKWTLHDCWAFTGHCAYFTMAGCDKWKTGCEDCPQKSAYPASNLLDRSWSNYARKKRVFTGVQCMTLITPSKWLANLTRESFLREYPVEVCNNTIDVTIFKPTYGDFRERYGLVGKKIILGVASVWDERKGLKDFLALSSQLDECCAIVLVGLSAQQMQNLPENILGISRTNSAAELAQIYTAADVFFNPTYEDNYPTVNLEAEACGTRVITYDTGGSPETIQDPRSRVIAVGDYRELLNLI